MDGALFERAEDETVDARSYLYDEFTLNHPAVVDCSYDVDDGGPINVFVTVPDEFEWFTDGMDFRTVPDGVHDDTWGGKLRKAVDPGEYVLVFHNSGNMRSGVDPSTRASLTFDLVVYKQ